MLFRSELFDINNATSGFINGELVGGIGCLRLSGGAYGKMGLGYFQGDDIQHWQKSSTGFTISVAFKADQHPNANGTIFSYGN